MIAAGSRSDLLEATASIMPHELEVSADESKSIIRLIRSDLDVSLRTFLGKNPKP